MKIDFVENRIFVSMSSPIHRYFVLNKQTNMISQFVSDSPNAPLLGQLNFSFPEGTHAIGRLDKDSEGLLLLTTDKKVTGLLFHTTKKHLRTYLVMVKSEMSEDTLTHLKRGVQIKVGQLDYYTAIPEAVKVIKDPKTLYPFAEDLRCQYSHTWLLITLTEGKYRQVRKMDLTLKHRCLRLIRLSIEDMTLNGIAPGEVKEFSKSDFYRLLQIENK